MRHGAPFACRYNPRTHAVPISSGSQCSKTIRCSPRWAAGAWVRSGSRVTSHWTAGRAGSPARRGHAGSGSCSTRFKQEARAASALNHPNVCTIHGLGETADGQQFIAMEHIVGETLRGRLHQAARSLDAAVDVGEQVASALTAAHAAGIVHGDLKPENVMLRSDGLVKVVDFGLAKLPLPDGAADATGRSRRRTPAWSLGLLPICHRSRRAASRLTPARTSGRSG